MINAGKRKVFHTSAGDMLDGLEAWQNPWCEFCEGWRPEKTAQPK
jgi:hypothetical protein